jgi:hypothetical protein
MDDLNRAEIRCFLSTTAEAVRHDPLCPVTAKAVFFDNFREGIAVVLVKYFRAGVPASPAVHTGPAIDSDIHVFCISSESGIPVAGGDHKGSEEWLRINGTSLLTGQRVM